MILRMSSNACVRDEWARSFSALSDIVGPAAGCDRAEPARQLRALLCIPFPAPMSRACHTIGSFPLGLPALRPERNLACTVQQWKLSKQICAKGQLNRHSRGGAPHKLETYSKIKMSARRGPMLR